MTAGDTADGAPPVREPAAEAELVRLRAEVEELRDRAGTERRRRARLLLVRRSFAALLIALAGLLAVTSVVGVWGARTSLDTGRWVATVGPLAGDRAVNAAVSRYLADEISGRLDLERRLTEALPPRADFAAGPLADAVHDRLRRRIAELMRTERFQELWREANRIAHARIVAVLENRSANVRVRGDTVTLNLLPLVNNVLSELEDQLPTVRGKRIDLPPLKSGAIPPGLHDRIENALGVSLPADFAQIKLYDRHELAQLQRAVLTFKRALAALLVGTFVLLVLALWISPARRRTLLQFGLWLVVGVTVLAAVLRAVRDQLLAAVEPGVYREGVRSALWTVFTTLRERGDQLLWFGAVLAVLAYLVGPGRLPVALRRYTVQGARATGRLAARTGQRLTKDSGFQRLVARWADVLRIAGVVVAALVALALSSWTGLLVTAAVLAAYEVAVTLVARGGASPAEGEAAPGGSAETGAPGGPTARGSSPG
ncbi:hypothetical protein [Streptomyces sp. NPDC059786]|uniref:hypothetical protein n=1 Tax=Streptomyces sp. NPDC059786 TaxID=3346946 RepID=UPI0036490E01